VAEVAPDVKIAPEMLHSTAYSTNEQGTNELLRDLTCLQCHALLLEWQHRKALRIC